ncbi:MHYT domain-containing protein, NO-binding membrane sensor [Cognatiyoonia koreensis]|uniref:MHYT domain-containing protein, NO-binding membrane sensor n=1 Tax=Cognatiyoonia koreensis TaxID=364200 RepID=A0A1I0QY39_9RHOB|nr:MHYT domain-containing protein [Cognatiyoonia koreensis]SEW32664.1 MHYT domain-containing protein, NO-binding membrane sensor [Cognatiyoonia koreensis]
MTILEANHDAFLVVMSCIVALVAGFTGLSLTRDLSRKPILQRQISIALAAIALGGGIWSMHFVAMLGLDLPILFYYDAAITLVSALTAILIVGAALVLLHFVERTPRVINAAGAIVGVGILGMHYIGMAGLQLCRAIYTPLGLVFSSVVAIFLCIIAFRIAYGRRENRNIFLGTICFAVAVCSVHFLAMAGTRFVAEPSLSEFGPTMSNEVLALGVIFTSFIIFGTFLWVSVTYLVGNVSTPDAEMPDAEAEIPDTASLPLQGLQIPCERDGTRIFISPADVALVRADGHYTQVYTEQDRLFCVWPITEATKRLVSTGFLQTHRSYLVNPHKVSRFERQKDKGRCIFAMDDLPPAPVSRSKLKLVQDALSAQPGAVHAN